MIIVFIIFIYEILMSQWLWLTLRLLDCLLLSFINVGCCFTASMRLFSIDCLFVWSFNVLGSRSDSISNGYRCWVARRVMCPPGHIFTKAVRSDISSKIIAVFQHVFGVSSSCTITTCPTFGAIGCLIPRHLSLSEMRYSSNQVFQKICTRWSALWCSRMSSFASFSFGRKNSGSAGSMSIVSFIVNPAPVEAEIDWS